MARSYEARSGWLPPKYESPDVREMNCDDTVMDVNDYQWVPCCAARSLRGACSACDCCSPPLLAHWFLHSNPMAV